MCPDVGAGGKRRLSSDASAWLTADASARRIEILSEMMAGNPHITAIDLRGNGFDADGLYALVQVTAARDCARHSAPRGVAQPEWRCGTRWRGKGGCRTLPTRDG